MDVELTTAQLARLKAKSIATAHSGNRAMAENYRRRRGEWQEQGRVRARDGDPLHQAGCLLYWAEGSKARNDVTFCNSDLHMMTFFIRFLRQCFELGPAEFSLRLNVYTGNGLTIQQVEDRWLDALELPRACLRKHTIDYRTATTTGLKPGKLPYGVGNLRVLRSTWLVQHIYGAIQEYGGFEEPRWLG